ncbi:unnamed protein product [Coregonus sp. 'balchen']|nr:unnamed protein product [Coregonus sp. 'balchen']
MVDQHQGEESSELLAFKANTPETSTSQPQLVHWCKKCGKRFDDICNLNQHQESLCREEKIKVVFKCEKRKVVFKCDDCGKDFKGSSSLRTHKRIHNPFYCSDCGRVLPNSIAFDRHKLMQHKEIQCPMCEKTFTLLGRLRDHYLHQESTCTSALFVKRIGSTQEKSRSCAGSVERASRLLENCQCIWGPTQRRDHFLARSVTCPTEQNFS